MSLVGRKLYVLARQAMVSEVAVVIVFIRIRRIRTPQTFAWFESRAGRYPASKSLYEQGIKPTTVSRQVNYSTKGGSAVLLHDGFPVLDAFQAISLVQTILEQEAERKEIGSDWSFAAQSTQKAVVYAVLTGLFTQAFAVKGPAVVGVMMGPESPLLPLRWVLGSTPGGSKATRVKAWCNIQSGGDWALHGDVAINSVLAAWLQSGGRLGSFALEIQHLFVLDEASGLPLWYNILGALTEDEFWAVWGPHSRYGRNTAIAVQKGVEDTVWPGK
ncbi:hypothetical protein B0H14DRAFT_3437673 [Mycena olivaceomarginata]|nr:hypothetical protein B0H14DRAFT_3437673 [Mycena olivaceomarginata]